jgi:hypothetical protein
MGVVPLVKRVLGRSPQSGDGDLSAEARIILSEVEPSLMGIRDAITSSRETT